MTELTRTGYQQPVSNAQYGFKQEQIDIIKSQVMPQSTNEELQLFLSYCQRTGLDPFARQIYAIKRKSKDKRTGGWIEKYSPEVSIDGFRAIAEKTGKYAGNDDPLFDNEDKPRKATVTVWKIVDGVRCGFTASARWEQYYPGETQGFMWNKMPHLMLGKVAESLALRKAFPQQMSGLYTTEEMQQADRDEKSIKELPPKSSIQSFDPDDFADIPEKQWEKKTQEQPAPLVDKYDQPHPLKKQITDKLIDIFGADNKNLEDAMEMLSEYRRKDGSIMPGVRDITRLSFKINAGKKVSQADVFWDKLSKYLNREEGTDALAIWRKARQEPSVESK